jgi:parvulin-like peptidyl-prolyl isomerase
LAKKKNVEKPQRQVTKRQLSNIKRQKRRQNFIFYGGILVIAVVLVIVFVGLYLGEIRPYHDTVVKVYDKEFSVQYLIDTVKYYSHNQPPQSVLTQLSYLIQSSISAITQTELIRYGGEQLGVTVDDDVVEESLKEKGIPVSDAGIDLERLSFLNEKLIEEYFKPQVPTSAEQVNIMAMFLESESQAISISAELSVSDNFTGLAAEHSLEPYSREKMGELGWHTRDFLEYNLETAVPVDYAFQAEIGTLSQPIHDENLTKHIGYWIVNIVERQENDQAHVQVMLLGSEQEANMVLQRLIIGEDFGELAREFSQDITSRELGGDLGWITPDVKTAAFDAAVFNPEAGDVGIIGPFPDNAVTTTGGYWLVQVVDREENRPLDQEEIDNLAGQAYSEWVAQLWEDGTDEIRQDLLTSDMTLWITEKLVDEYS